MGKKLTFVKWSCYCGAEITSTDDGDGAFIVTQCTNGHTDRRPRKREYKRPGTLKQQLRTGYTPNDAA